MLLRSIVGSTVMAPRGILVATVRGASLMRSLMRLIPDARV